MIYHLYKTDCYRASRVLMQSNWDGESIFIHLSQKDDFKKNYRLSLNTLIRLINRFTNDDVIIFHAQSALPYLMAALILRKILRKKTSLIYDIHDLHEKESYSSFRNEVRYYGLGLLEKFIFKIKLIKKLTVSEGLAKTMALKYKCRPPTVVRNISSPPDSDVPALNPKLSNAVIFFGTRERVPLGIIKELQNSNIELHLYGKDITKDWLETKISDQEMQSVRFFGEYNPKKLDFLNNYKALILFSPENNSLNFKYSLPNKLFQSLEKGLAVIVSENFVEMIELFADVSMAVIGVRADNLALKLKDVFDKRTTTDAAAALVKLRSIYTNEKSKYLAAVHV